MQEKWTKILYNLEKMLDPGIFKVWVAPLKAEFKNSQLFIYAPNVYMAEWIKRHLLSDLTKACKDILGADVNDIAISISCDPVKNNPVSAGNIIEKALPKPLEQSQLPLKTKTVQNKWHYSFEDLVRGPSNNLAVAAAMDMCNQGQVRTLFVNSAPGLGKTHIAQATGCVFSRSSSLKVAYLTGEQFASRYVAAMRTKELEELKQHLCSMDVLLLEDVHFLAKKKAMQEMILGIVKNIQSRDARVIFTSSFSPRQIQDIDSQLVSYFCSGILANIETPDIEMRKEILRKKAKIWQVQLPDDVCDILSSHVSADIRQLESCLKNMVFKAKLMNAGLNAEMALETVKQYADSISTLDISAIVRLVCENYGITEQQLRSKSRKQEYVSGRNTAFFLARKHTGMSLEEIGYMFNRKHSTVMRGITQVEQEMANESRQGRQFARAVAIIERKCGFNG